MLEEQLPPGAGAGPVEFVDAALAVRERSDPAIRILVGGSAFDDAPGVWRKLGADAYAATLAELTDTAEALLASRQ